MLNRSKPVLVSFSGIDGAGKSTQIARLEARLSEAGLRVRKLAFWDDVVFLSRFRAGASHRVLGGEMGVGSPERPVQRADKNVRRWYLTLLRSALYLTDVLKLRRAVLKAQADNPAVVIFDRYVYDQLVNVPDSWIGRKYIRLLLRLSPRLDIAFLLDADPEAALRRKPEYPVDFLRRYRRAYHRLCPNVAEMVMLPPAEVEEVEAAIARQFEKRTAVPIWPDGQAERISG